MRLALSIIAGLVLLAATVQGRNLPLDRIDALLEQAVAEDEFLHYLLQEELHTKAVEDCSFKSSSFGGNGGNPFDELPANCTGIVKKILIRGALYVDAIQITYELPDGTELVGGYYGGGGGTESIIEIDVANGERIIGVFGRSYTYLDQLGFITSKGRFLGPYGGYGGDPFTIEGCNVAGVFGRSFDWMDSIGFYCNAV